MVHKGGAVMSGDSIYSDDAREHEISPPSGDFIWYGITARPILTLKPDNTIILRRRDDSEYVIIPPIEFRPQRDDPSILTSQVISILVTHILTLNDQ